MQNYALVRPWAGGADDRLLYVERHGLDDRLRIPVEYYAITAITLSTGRLCLRYTGWLFVVRMVSPQVWLVSSSQ